MATKGITLESGQVVVLELDGTLVFIESVQPTFAAVVALPDQFTGREDDRVFTPGRVGSKKISPFSRAGRVVPVSELTERNTVFISAYEQLRTDHGPNYVDRSPEELAAHEAANAPKPDKSVARAAKKAERDAAKAAKQAATPRYLRRCVTCNEQPGHPDHGTDEGKHEFVEPAPEAKAPKAAKVPKTPRDPNAPRKTKAPKALPAGPFKWVGNDGQLRVLAGVNPKYKPNNSGAVIVDAIKASGDAGITLAAVAGVLGQHPRWSGVPLERIEFALKQLLDTGMVAV